MAQAEEEQKPQEQLSNLNFVDDCYFSSLFAEDEKEEEEEVDQEQQQQEDVEEDEVEKVIFPVSDVKYAQRLQFQEALMGSIAISQGRIKIDVSEAAELQSPEKRMKVGEEEEEKEGESSHSFCEICAERKETDEMFKVEACVHSYCSDCISKHVATKVQDSVVVVTCPGVDCKTVLELDTCRPVLPRGVIDRWEDALCEELIGESQRFYCPFKDCSAMLLKEENETEVIKESECPYCHRLFCAHCQVPWHSGVDCEGFQQLNEDEREREDIMVMELAKSKKWSRCPQCKFYVERTEGCPHMSCRSVLVALIILGTTNKTQKVDSPETCDGTHLGNDLY